MGHSPDMSEAILILCGLAFLAIAALVWIFFHATMIKRLDRLIAIAEQLREAVSKQNNLTG